MTGITKARWTAVADSDHPLSGGRRPSAVIRTHATDFPIAAVLQQAQGRQDASERFRPRADLRDSVRGLLRRRVVAQCRLGVRQNGEVPEVEAIEREGLLLGRNRFAEPAETLCNRS